MASYLEEVESLFLSTVRKGMSLRASDLEIVRDWDRRKIPIDVVSRGILYGIQRFLAQAEPDAPVPASLRYFRTAVEKEFKTWERAAARGLAMTSAMPAVQKKASSDEPLTERARKILERRQNDATESDRQIYADALKHYDASVTSTPLADLLFQVEDMVVSAMGASLGTERLSAIGSATADKAAAAAARGIGQRAIKDLERNLFRKAVAAECGFRSFLDEVLQRPGTKN